MSYLSSHCDPLRERLTRLESWKAWVNDEFRQQISNLFGQLKKLELCLENFKVRLGVVEKEVGNNNEKNDKEKICRGST